MADNRRDIPCSVCGNLMWQSRTSLPPGQATCQPCRRKRVTFKPQSCTWDNSPRTCQQCGMTYDPTAYNQRYCSVACRPHRTGLKVASADERGYGKEHRAVRKQWAVIVEAGQANCCLCGHWIEPGSRWDLDHTPDRSGYRGAAHHTCNRRDGASRGNRTRQRRLIDKQCATCAQPFETIYPKQVYCSKGCRRRSMSAKAVTHWEL
jgi:hypothetical protein